MKSVWNFWLTRNGEKVMFAESVATQIFAKAKQIFPDDAHAVSTMNRPRLTPFFTAAKLISPKPLK